MNLVIAFAILVSGILLTCEGNLPKGTHGRISTHQHTLIHIVPISKCNFYDKYRTIDGTCNNVYNIQWGSTGTPLIRLLPNAYSDGMSLPRIAEPTARQVSVAIHPVNDERSDFTLMVMQWGQFLDHDITLTPINDDENCCSANDPLYFNRKAFGDECFNIPIINDEFFTDQKCMSFTRSARVTVGKVEEQFNAITAFIDASNVYGSSDEELEALRGPDGTLLTEPDFDPPVNEKHLLPTGDPESCHREKGERCFLAGDERSNEQPALTVMHTIFVREHNRLVKELKKLGWKGEALFEEARRIVGALMQQITYTEFLPIVLSDKVREQHSLDVGKDTIYKYDPYLNPSITNPFATAAFRFGHTLIPEFIDTYHGQLLLKDHFFTPTAVLNYFEAVAQGIYAQNSMDADRFFSHSVTRHLFEREDQPGFDLVALNIQRGRDHGLPPYNDYRERYCNLSRVMSLEELFPCDEVAQSAYHSVDDVDLFSGGISETPLDGSLLGETFSCLVANQFQRLKFGDRYFFENQKGPGAFTKKQLKQIRKVRLSKVICDNTEVKRIPADVFRPVNLISNPLVRCKKLPGMNLKHWENPYHHYHKMEDGGDGSMTEGPGGHDGSGSGGDGSGGDGSGGDGSGGDGSGGDDGGTRDGSGGHDGSSEMLKSGEKSP